MDDQMLTDFIAYLDARADSVAIERKLITGELFGIVTTEGVQMCTDISPELKKLFKAVCKQLKLVPKSERGTTAKARFQREVIEYRGLKVYTYESEDL